MLRLASAIVFAALAVACGPKAPASDEANSAKLEEAAKTDEASAEKKQQAEQQAAYDAVKTDEAKVDELADAGNGFALHHRGAARLKSDEFTVQQGGFEDMEAAVKAGNADAQLWVGTRMAYGLEGYQLKPNSGLMMLEKAAKQDHIEAILAVGLMYEQDTFMHDVAKAKTWYERGAALGSDKAKDALAKLGTQEDF
jgi:TPR repeat protein